MGMENLRNSDHRNREMEMSYYTKCRAVYSSLFFLFRRFGFVLIDNLSSLKVIAIEMAQFFFLFCLLQRDL